jgi:hypothetical protein
MKRSGVRVRGSADECTGRFQPADTLVEGDREGVEGGLNQRIAHLARPRPVGSSERITR